MEICTLSSYINEHKIFVKLAQDYYFVVDELCKEYPKYFEWYWSKEIPRVFAGTGEVIACIVDGNIAGVAFLKKTDAESKISTLFVVKSYRRRLVATKLLEKAFDYLGTTKPLISIADYKVSMFASIIAKYHWELTEIMSIGYYNSFSREFVYNGKLSKWCLIRPFKAKVHF